MSEIINMNDNNQQGSISLKCEELIADARKESEKNSSISFPIAELTTLGAGVSSLIPAFRTFTQTTTVNTSGLYRLVNETEGVLKKSKQDFSWGALKTADGTSKMAKLKEADALSATTQGTFPVDPATIMMAAALYSIEKQLGEIKEIQKQIISFLQIEKESEIEADLISLSKIIENYKYIWNNDMTVANNHKMVKDIQRTARKNVISYQKAVNEVLKAKNMLVLNAKVNSTLEDLQKKFKYYRLSLYTFSMAAMAEIMLGMNFNEEYILGVKSEIDKMVKEYGDQYKECSEYLEKMKKMSVETNVVKGIGVASDAVGKLIGKIPKVKDGQVDEFLIEGGAKLQRGIVTSREQLIESFAEIKNPGIDVFTTRLNEMIEIYNHTSEICFDKERVYLVVG